MLQYIQSWRFKLNGWFFPDLIILDLTYISPAQLLLDSSSLKNPCMARTSMDICNWMYLTSDMCFNCITQFMHAQFTFLRNILGDWHNCPPFRGKCRATDLSISIYVSFRLAVLFGSHIGHPVYGIATSHFVWKVSGVVMQQHITFYAYWFHSFISSFLTKLPSFLTKHFIKSYK